MSKIFTRTFRVRFSEMNADGWVGPAEYMRYLVETAYDWGDAGGFGAQDSQVLGIAWVVRENEFAFFHPLRQNDVFEFTIWMTDWKRVRGWRAFELHIKDSDLLIARGTQQLVSLDAETLRPTVPPESIMAYYRLENPRTFEKSFASDIASRYPSLPEPPPQTLRIRRVVEWRDIDFLGHVNNAVYFTFTEQAAAQALSETGWSVEKLRQENLALDYHQVHVKYHSPAVWGDMLEIETYLLDLHENGGLRRVAIHRPADQALILECSLDWRLVDRVSRESTRLPTEMFCGLEQEYHRGY